MNDERKIHMGNAVRFLDRSREQVGQMTRSVPQLIEGDRVAWQAARACAERLSAEARQCGFDVLGACAREFLRIADEQFAGAELSLNFLMAATTAIETIALEHARLDAINPGAAP